MHRVIYRYILYIFQPKSLKIFGINYVQKLGKERRRNNKERDQRQSEVTSAAYAHCPGVTRIQPFLKSACNDVCRVSQLSQVCLLLFSLLTYSYNNSVCVHCCKQQCILLFYLSTDSYK